MNLNHSPCKKCFCLFLLLFFEFKSCLHACTLKVYEEEEDWNLRKVGRPLSDVRAERCLLRQGYFFMLVVALPRV